MHPDDPTSRLEVRFDRDAGDTCFPPPHRHSDFWKDESGYFQRTVVELAAQIEGEAPALTS